MVAMAGGMALLLGNVGIYSVIAYVVPERTRERTALGAEPAGLSSMFVRQGLWLAGVGSALGLIAAAGLTRLMSSLLFGRERARPGDVPGSVRPILRIERDWRRAAQLVADGLVDERVWQVPHGDTLDNVKNNASLEGVTIPNTGANTRGTGDAMDIVGLALPTASGTGRGGRGGRGGPAGGPGRGGQ